MPKKNFEADLTPQNEEWIKLIPNKDKNLDIIFNKLIETAINEGLLLEVITQSLTLSDLKKFKVTYEKMQSSRADCLDELSVTPIRVERKKVTQSMIEEDQMEVTPEPEKKAISSKKKPTTHGFDEDTF